MRKAEILSLKKHEIRYVKKLPKRKINYAFIFSMFIVVFVLTMSFGGDLFKSISNSMAYIYNPVSSLYNDNSDAVFTNASSYLVEKENLNIALPIKGAEVSVDTNGNINFVVVKSIMVGACEAGIVEEVGTTNDGIKYIKIKHCLDIYSLIENVDMIGVAKGEVVKRGQDIATAKTGNTVTLRLFEGDTQLTNIKVEQSKIIWQD